MNSRIMRGTRLGLELVLLVLLGLTAWSYGQARQRLLTLDVEFGALAAEAKSLREDNERLLKTEVDSEELARLRKENQEIYRLRGQYQEWQQLKESYAALEAENTRLKTQQAANRTSAPPAARAPNVPLPPVWIGVELMVTADASGEQRVAVRRAVPGSPAEKAQLQPGDVILALDTQPVTSVEDVKDAVTARQPGQVVLLDIERAGQLRRVGLRVEAPSP